jgi:nucleotide-binding universal stress UspA family protein
MNRNILIPVDLSEHSARAVDAAIEVTEPSETTITVLHVIETLQDVEYEELESFYGQIKAKAEKALALLTEGLAARGYDAHAEIVFGRRGSEILRYADERNIDLIVMKTHVLDREHPAQGLGTLGQQVALASRCSVLLAR